MTKIKLELGPFEGLSTNVLHGEASTSRLLTVSTQLFKESTALWLFCSMEMESFDSKVVVASSVIFFEKSCYDRIRFYLHKQILDYCESVSSGMPERKSTGTGDETRGMISFIADKTLAEGARGEVMSAVNDCLCLRLFGTCSREILEFVNDPRFFMEFLSAGVVLRTTRVGMRS